jgi:hypothetical protein
MVWCDNPLALEKITKGFSIVSSILVRINRVIDAKQDYSTPINIKVDFFSNNTKE